MGSTAFIMAEMLGIPYTAVAKAALIPAILYFLAVLFGVDIYAAKHGLKGSPLPTAQGTQHAQADLHACPLIFLIFCMAVFNMTIVRSGLLTIIVTLVLVEINPKTRMTKEQWLQIPVQTVKSAVSVGIACAMAGIISGVIMGSGLGYRISSILTSVAGTSMLLLLVLTMVVSLIMGMGVPTTAAYLVLASLVAPTMIQLGIPRWPPTCSSSTSAASPPSLPLWRWPPMPAPAWPGAIQTRQATRRSVWPSVPSSCRTCLSTIRYC